MEGKPAEHPHPGCQEGLLGRGDSSSSEGEASKFPGLPRQGVNVRGAEDGGAAYPMGPVCVFLTERFSQLPVAHTCAHAHTPCY